MSTVRKLNIGGTQEKKGWEVLNIMLSDYVDHQMDATDLSAFSDETFDEIYASHILEHLDYINKKRTGMDDGEIVQALKEWRRVLKPDGALKVSVPDMDVLTEIYSDHVNFGVQDRFELMRVIFGGHLNEYDYHKVGFNEELLTYFLGLAGFTQISRVEVFDEFDDTSSVNYGGRLISLNMQAVK